MAESPGYKNLLRFLNDCQAEYLIVGGHAVMKYTEPLYTKDLDIWINASAQNSERVLRALAQFGAPLTQDKITAETFRQPDVVYQIGVAPVRVDVLTSITGVPFADAWGRRVEGSLFGVAVWFLSAEDLVRNKESTGRGSDVKHLKRFRRDETGH